MAIKIIEVNNQKQWEDFLSKHPEANFLQSWYWGEFHKALGHKIIRSGFFRDSKLEGVMLSLVENAKRGRYLTVPGGPIINWEDKTWVNAFAQEVKKIARDEKCVFVRVRPQILENEKNSNLFKKLGFKGAPMHLHAELTHQLDLTKSEDELLASMRKTTRYEIKQAIKEEIKITVSKNIDDIDDFYQLQKETAIRQHFVEFDKNFLKQQFSVFDY